MSLAERVIERIRDEGVKTVDLRFTDLAGLWRHSSIEASDVTAAMLERGLIIDGSAVPGWRDVAESDLLLKPDLACPLLDPFAAQPTLILHCDGAEPATGLGYERDPRSVARRAEAYVAESGIADRVEVALELAFFIFDDVRIETGAFKSAYSLEASESAAAGGRAYAGGNPGHRPARGAADLALPPADHHADIRAEIAGILAGEGFPELRHEHGPAAAQNRLMVGPGGLVESADRFQLAKYVIHQVAASYGKSATFMPRPIADEPGAPLHITQTLRQGDRPVFAGQGYADLSDLCLSFIAGILAHARALNAFTNPTTNSYKRLQPGMDEPTLLAYAAYNRSAAVRVPYADRPDGKRTEIRFPDPGANPYLAFSAILMAGLDGIARKMQPGDAMDRNLYDLRPDELDGIASTCRSLEEALNALETDHEFLVHGEVMPYELIEAYLQVKRQELDHLARRPTPAEFELYYGR